MGEFNPEGLSIEDAYSQGLAESTDKLGDGSPAESKEDPKDNGETPADKTGDGEKKPDDGNKPPEDGTKPKEPVIDPDNGKYEGEYKKERFDGLMGQWQKDRARLRE